MATPNNGTGDQISLDEATQASAAPGSHDSILDAADLFQQQLDQITNWKQQLGGQMEAMRRDGTKLLERQKTLAQERNQLNEERAQFAGDREKIQKLQGEVDAESKRLAQRASELEAAQRQLAELEGKREQAQRELAAREKSLTEMEARHLSEDVRLRESLEQMEGQRRQLKDAQRQAAHDREQLDNQTRELNGRAQSVEQNSQSLASREQALNGAQQQLQQAQNDLQNRQNEISAQQADLQSRIAATQAQQQQLEEDRQKAAALRQEAQRKLETFEHEQADQLEAMSKQTKRISERRAEVEAAEANLEQTLSGRIAQATESLRQELAAAKGGQSDRITQLEAQIRQAEAAAQSWQARESQFQQEIAGAQGQLGKLKQEIQQASASLEKVAAERTALSTQLEKQIEQGKAEAAKWQQAIDAARTQSAGGGEALQQAQEEARAARHEFKTLKMQVEQFKTAKETLEFQLEVRAEDGAKQLENLRQGLTQQLAERDGQIAQLKQALEAGKSGSKGGTGSPADAQKLQELAKHSQMLEQQRNEIATQLFSIQDTARRQQEEFLLAKNGLESKLLAATEKNSKLEAEKSAWKQRPQTNTGNGKVDPKAAQQAAFQRDRLLRQAKALRAFRLQIRDTQGGLEQGRAELAQQREQIRARRENLEQVKRLLEKQEMVMARKLADHNAIKTVAAVGIFVIMVLGSVFFGIYRFVHPTYRSEAVVQLAVPQDLQGPEADLWITKQMDFIKGEENYAQAWKILRSADVHYGMHDVRDEWVASLPSHLLVTRDPQSKSVAIRYTGPDAQGVADVSNALATSYTLPGQRESTEQTKAVGLGAQVLAKATPPIYPVEDNRMMLAMMTVAGTLFVSLVLIMIFRYFIARQLKEIDQMADAHELEDAKADMAEGAQAGAGVTV